MKDALDLVIEQIRAMSPEELIAELAAHRDTDIAVSIREVESVSHLSRILGELEDIFEIIGLRDLLQVKSHKLLDYIQELRAANDERFALAA